MNVHHRILIALLVACVSCQTGRAATWREVEKTCPLDGTKIKARVPATVFMTGFTPDLRPLGVGVDPFVAGIVQCPKCGFAAHDDHFDEFRNANAQKAAKALRELTSPHLFRRNDAAILIERLSGNDSGVIAKLTLSNKWLADDTGDPDLIRARIAQAAIAHQTALEEGNVAVRERPMIAYATGELLRQSGRNDEAVKWFDRSLEGRSMFPGFMIQRQRLLALHKGRVTPELLNSLKEATPTIRVAAVSLLRESDSPEALNLLENICLEGPDELCRFAFQSLAGRSPLKKHLPIYLKAIGSRKFRAAQAGSRAVVFLRAREAAPVLVKALKNPPENAAFRLRWALSVLATPKEVDALIGLMKDNNDSPFVICGLINTRSPKAIPAIMKFVERKQASWLRYCFRDSDGQAALKVAADWEELLSRLPNLETADLPSGAANFRVLLLGMADRKGASDELAVGLARGEPLEVEAAIELARRNDDRGKSAFLQNLRSIMQSGSDNWPLVIPLLTPAVQNALQQERDRWQHSIDFQRERIADASSDDERRRSQKRLEEMLNRENWWMAPWLRLIGGTRHPDAREIVLPYLKDPNHQAREGAVLGLEAFADAPVRTRLTELVKQESKPSVLAAALRVLGRTGGPKELPPILDAGAEPMPIVTRIAWIEAVTTLGGLDQIRPRLESLVKSPNEGLATAAEKALARD